MIRCFQLLLGCGSEVSRARSVVGPKCLRTLWSWVQSVSRHFRPESEVSCVRSVLCPKCPVSIQMMLI